MCLHTVHVPPAQKLVAMGVGWTDLGVAHDLSCNHGSKRPSAPPPPLAWAWQSWEGALSPPHPICLRWGGRERLQGSFSQTVELSATSLWWLPSLLLWALLPGPAGINVGKAPCVSPAI